MLTNWFLVIPDTSQKPHTKRTRQWIRARGTISPSGGIEAHLSALAYMSDSYFIGTVSRVHNLWRFAKPPRPSSNKTTPASSSSASANTTKDNHPMARLEHRENAHDSKGRSIGMMVSLDHTIYFHRPRDIRADEWLFSESESPWAGDGRGLVLQRIWNKEGQLVASCVQEGLVRLVQSENGMRESGKL